MGHRAPRSGHLDAPRRQGGSMSRILLVDDDATLRRTLQLNLKARGHEVTTAASGTEALRGALTQEPELIILDLGLPDMDGIEVLLQLRGDLPAPVIVLSARREAHDKVLALDIGAIDYVTKPFSMDELMARVRAACLLYTSDAADDLLCVD